MHRLLSSKNKLIGNENASYRAVVTARFPAQTLNEVKSDEKIEGKWLTMPSYSCDVICVLPGFVDLAWVSDLEFQLG